MIAFLKDRGRLLWIFSLRRGARIGLTRDIFSTNATKCPDIEAPRRSDVIPSRVCTSIRGAPADTCGAIVNCTLLPLHFRSQVSPTTPPHAANVSAWVLRSPVSVPSVGFGLPRERPRVLGKTISGHHDLRASINIRGTWFRVGDGVVSSCLAMRCSNGGAVAQAIDATTADIVSIEIAGSDLRNGSPTLTCIATAPSIKTTIPRAA